MASRVAASLRAPFRTAEDYSASARRFGVVRIRGLRVGRPDFLHIQNQRGVLHPRHRHFRVRCGVSQGLLLDPLVGGVSGAENGQMARNPNCLGGRSATWSGALMSAGLAGQVSGQRDIRRHRAPCPHPAASVVAGSPCSCRTGSSPLNRKPGPCNGNVARASAEYVRLFRSNQPVRRSRSVPTIECAASSWRDAVAARYAIAAGSASERY